MLFIVVLGGLEIFKMKSIFSHSTDVYSKIVGFFPLPKFRSVADLKVNILAWHVPHEFMFDKKRY